MPRRSTQRDPIRTPGRNFEENRALHGPVHVAKILGTPPDEPKPASDEPESKSKTALHDEVPRPFRPPSPASCTSGLAPVGVTQAEGLRSVQGFAEEVAGGDAAPVAPLDAAAGPLGTELAEEVAPDEQGVGAPPDPKACSPARSAMSQTSRIPPAAPRSSAKPAHTPRRQSPGSKLPTPRRKDAHYKEDKAEDKVRGSSLAIYLSKDGRLAYACLWQSRSASLSSAWAALALRWLATHEPHIRPLFLTQDTPSSPVGRERHRRRTRQDARQGTPKGTPFGVGPQAWGRATGGAIGKEARFHSRPQ